MIAMKQWFFALLFLALLLLWGSWILRYESHVIEGQAAAIWIVDRWSGCATLYVLGPRKEGDLQKFRTRICPGEDL